ncbi:kelch repeat-containing protein [Corallococcus sp. CA054B]|uniref:Kelch repeat-containing protein n=1 Tax=Corallococcus sp. CA054B TaxID=2316734 RepID=UPI00131572C4|nr:kelch repeat-containing protein [Corallococcus sp. CA054B]
MTRSFASTFSSIVFLLTSAACGPAPSDDAAPTGPSSAIEVGTERQALASWSSAAPMSTARFDHSATVLPSGKVLVAGGDPGTTTYLSSAALYDPATNTWAATGSMTQARSAHVAVLLSSGKVLVIGGTFGSTTTAELYDPATGTWTATGSLATLRTNFTATLLSSGQVLVTGGRGNGGVYLTSCELYDPATGTWSTTGSLAAGRMDHSAVLLANGQVLVSGGLYMVFTSLYRLDSAELYDPATGTWSTTGNLATGRSEHLSLLLPSGNALIIGGLAGSGRLTSYYSVSAAESFSAGTMSSAGSMSSPRHGHAAAVLPSGAVLVAGGLNKIGGSSTTQYLSSASLYDPATGTWSATASMLAVRNHFTLSPLSSGKVLAVGGTNSSGLGLASTELYTP